MPFPGEGAFQVCRTPTCHTVNLLNIKSHEINFGIKNEDAIHYQRQRIHAYMLKTKMREMGGVI